MKAVLVTILLFLAVVYSGCISQSNPVSFNEDWRNSDYVFERFADNGAWEGRGAFELKYDGESSFTGNWSFSPAGGGWEKGTLTAKIENGKLLVNFTPGNVDNNLIGKFDVTERSWEMKFTGEYEHIGFAGVMAHGYFTGKENLNWCGTP